jgi:hypothetical protein
LTVLLTIVSVSFSFVFVSWKKLDEFLLFVITLVGNHSFMNFTRVLVFTLIGSCCFLMILFAAFVVRVDHTDTALKQHEQQIGEIAYDLGFALRIDNNLKQQEQQLGEIASQLGGFASHLGEFASQLGYVRQELLDHTRKEQPMAFTIFITIEYWKQGKTQINNSHQYVRHLLSSLSVL